MQIVKAIFLFYRKLIIPSLVFSLFIGFIGLKTEGLNFLNTVGISFIFSGLLFHYFIYEVWNNKEYYFYFNLGLSRYILWLITFIFHLSIGLTIILV